MPLLGQLEPVLAPFPEPHSITYHPFPIMLNWSITFLVVAIIAAVLGFGGLAGTAASIAKILFFVALVLLLISVVRGRSVTAAVRDVSRAVR